MAQHRVRRDSRALSSMVTNQSWKARRRLIATIGPTSAKAIGTNAFIVRSDLRQLVVPPALVASVLAKAAREPAARAIAPPGHRSLSLEIRTRIQRRLNDRQQRRASVLLSPSRKRGGREKQ